MDDLISREKALEELEDWERCYTWDEHCRESKEDYIVSPSGVIASLPSAEQWIPCSKEMPKEDHKVGLHYPNSELVLMSVFKTIDNISIVDFGHTINGIWWSDTCNCHVANGWEVLAWMPLPQPYKGGQDGSNKD